MMTPSQCRAARSWLRITLVQLSDATGVHPNTINRWECGKTQMTAELIARLESVLTEQGLNFADDPEAIWRETGGTSP